MAATARRSRSDARQMDAVRIVLSGVARVSRTRRDGCGKQLLAQMLCGSNSKSVARNRLDKLSTFGLLAHLAQTQVVQLIDALLMAGLLEQTEIEPFRPVVQLTPRGIEVMHGRDDDEVRLSLAADLASQLKPGSSSAAAPDVRSDFAGESAAEAQLVQRLKQWRDEQRQSENLPAYRVLTNALVDELAHASAQQRRAAGRERYGARQSPAVRRAVAGAIGRCRQRPGGLRGCAGSSACGARFAGARLCAAARQCA